jgi:hypothetical protein
LLKRLSPYLFILFLVFPGTFQSQDKKGPVARFSFNDGSREDEISHRKPKFVNTGWTEDRFGNPKSSALIFGNQDSYINLGDYPAIKPKEGTISLWIKIENIIYSGRGIAVNPIITTRNCNCNDFNEAYALSINYERKLFEGVLSNDSLKQVVLGAGKQYEKQTWYHLVMAYDFYTASFYLDGELQSTFGKNFESHFEPADSVAIGLIFNEQNRRVFLGAIDDIEFYDRVLSPEEIYALYKAPNPNKSNILVRIILWVLIVSACIFCIYLILRYRFTLKLKRERRHLELINNQLENDLRINRALMNPHFVFNAMNALHNHILANNNEKASDYLVMFSKLLRKILDSNMSDNISLEQELELLELYLEIERLRFKDPFKYLIVKDKSIVPSASIIPIMMLQPFIENAIWHGLLDKEGEKTITISFTLMEENYLQCVIEDNGTGRKMKAPNPLEKKSQATNFVRHRLALLNKLHMLKCSLTIIDKEQGQGTIVKLILPILNKIKPYAAPSHTY